MGRSAHRHNGVGAELRVIEQKIISAVAVDIFGQQGLGAAAFGQVSEERASAHGGNLRDGRTHRLRQLRCGDSQLLRIRIDSKIILPSLGLAIGLND